ncbi:hypothetical protein A4G99_15810 [Haladaptatus sp. R4]|uniref:hypothetical protein n=1 Tax=Haladaptatus sp. R4 TaxID=1679489 RepID=UPI0007B4E570|nr:hypothetical protein [Haladaptatus sp. R4]KZN22993.1 hypothetical protein A4G99_15810 [Haladaptatus sp. R4]
MPDGLAWLDDVFTITSDDDPETVADKVNSYRKDYPLLNRLAGTNDANIESGHTTGSTQPSQTVKNLAQAHNDGNRCLFFARENVAEQVYNTVAHAPVCCRSNHSVDGERRFYTGTNTLSIEGKTITRPGNREKLKPPIIPEYEMNGDLREWDVIVVPPETTTPDGSSTLPRQRPNASH